MLFRGLRPLDFLSKLGFSNGGGGGGAAADGDDHRRERRNSSLNSVLGLSICT